jgi:hypothetical protein
LEKVLPKVYRLLLRAVVWCFFAVALRWLLVIAGCKTHNTNTEQRQFELYAAMNFWKTNKGKTAREKKFTDISG